MISSILRASLIAVALCALAGVGSSSYAQSECETEEDVKRTNHWSSKDEVGRYVGDEVKLLIELWSSSVGDLYADPVFDTLVFWKPPKKIASGLVGILIGLGFKGGCVQGEGIFVEKKRLKDFAGIIERYRQSTDRDIRKFLPLAKQLYYLAEEYYAQGKYAEAESFYKQALAIWEKTYGESDSPIQQTVDKLGLIYEAQDDYVKSALLYEAHYRDYEAILAYKKAISNWPDSVGDSLYKAMVLENYAALLRTRNRHDEADKLEASAKAIRAKHAQ